MNKLDKSVTLPLLNLILINLGTFFLGCGLTLVIISLIELRHIFKKLKR